MADVSIISKLGPIKSKSMDWFLYDKDFQHKEAKGLRGINPDSFFCKFLVISVIFSQILYKVFKVFHFYNFILDFCVAQLHLRDCIKVCKIFSRLQLTCFCSMIWSFWSCDCQLLGEYGPTLCSVTRHNIILCIYLSHISCGYEAQLVAQKSTT